MPGLFIAAGRRSPTPMAVDGLTYRAQPCPHVTMFRASSLMRLAMALMMLGAMGCSAPAEARDTLRCGARLVQVGASPAEVLARCGKPAFRDDWGATLIEGLGQPPMIEQWVYDFGPHQLIQVLLFRDQQLHSIASDGYGLSHQPRGGCRPTDIVPGLTKYRLLARCGEPTRRAAAHVLAPLRLPREGIYDPRHHAPRVVEVYREQWLYNFGPATLLRELTLDNGRVVSVGHGGRGF